MAGEIARPRASCSSTMPIFAGVVGERVQRRDLAGFASHIYFPTPIWLCSRGGGGQASGCWSSGVCCAAFAGPRRSAPPAQWPCGPTYFAERALLGQISAASRRSRRCRAARSLRLYWQDWEAFVGVQRRWDLAACSWRRSGCLRCVPAPAAGTWGQDVGAGWRCGRHATGWLEPGGAGCFAGAPPLDRVCRQDAAGRAPGFVVLGSSLCAGRDSDQAAVFAGELLAGDPLPHSLLLLLLFGGVGQSSGGPWTTSTTG
jgi:hypothetical protein